MFLKRRVSTLFLVTLVLSVVALSFYIVTPKAHAEITAEELGQLEAQVDVITQVVQKLTATHGQVLGVSASSPMKYFQTTVVESGDKRALTPDGSWWQGGKDVQKKRILMQIEMHKKQIAELEAQLKKINEETTGSTTPPKHDPKPEAKPTPRFNGFTYPDTSNKVEASLAFGRPKDGGPAVDGPVLRGTINWGDGVTENVHALVNEKFNKVTHTYKKTGKFTLVITNATDKKTATREVVVGPKVNEI